MLKILRKHNKWFMVVFGTLLMLTFLIDQGASGAADVGKRVIAETRDGKIRARDLQHAEWELGLLNQVAPILVRFEYQVEGGMHWLLLTRQAERMGLVGDEQDGDSWIPELMQSELYNREMYKYVQQGIPASFARQFIERQSQQIMTEAQQATETLRAEKARVAGEYHLTEVEFGKTLAKLRGVSRLSRLYAGAAVPSDRRAIMQFRREGDAILVNGVTIPAAAIADTMPEPDPALMQAHYETYRTSKPGTGDLGFGYLQEPRLKLEWFRLSRADVSAQIKLDPIDVHKHWQLNRGRYPGEFDAEEVAVEKELRDSKIEAVMNTAGRLVKDRVRASLTRLPVDGPYRKLPANWAQDGPKLDPLAQEMVDAVKSGVNVTLPKPAVERPIGDWVELSKAGALTGIGESFFRAGQSGMRFADLVALCKEIAPQTTLDLQAGVPFTTVVMENAAGDHFYFTVVEVKPEGPAESLDVVRTQVVADLKKLAAFDKLKADLETYRMLAASSDLKTLASTFKKPGGTPDAPQPLDVFEGERVTRAAVQRAELNTEELRSAVLDAMAKLGEIVVISPENQGARTVAVALPKSFSTVVLQITGQDPLVVEDLRSVNPFVADSMATAELRDVFQTKGLTSALSYQVMSEAAGLKEEGETPEKPAADGKTE